MSDLTFLCSIVVFLCIYPLSIFLSATVFYFRRGQFFTGLLSGMLLGPLGILLGLLMPRQGYRSNIRHVYHVDWGD